MATQTPKVSTLRVQIKLPPRRGLRLAEFAAAARENFARKSREKPGKTLTRPSSSIRKRTGGKQMTSTFRATSARNWPSRTLPPSPARASAKTSWQGSVPSIDGSASAAEKVSVPSLGAFSYLAVPSESARRSALGNSVPARTSSWPAKRIPKRRSQVRIRLGELVAFLLQAQFPSSGKVKSSGRRATDSRHCSLGVQKVRHRASLRGNPASARWPRSGNRAPATAQACPP